ncbi:MAG: hypothetical protein QOC55_2685 [Thermoleophilaceae bacterium]|nr:hypothetical protein [Thermoleophilaceae bacterium]
MTRPRHVLRLVAALSLLVLALPGDTAGAAGIYAGPTPQLPCGPGSLPETGTQGRVPAAEVASGRAAKGYRCNTVQVSHFGATGGFQVHRYVDKAGHDCAFYDSTLLFPKDAAANAAEGLGVYVMDMKDPAHPVHTASLTTPAMLSPHESLRVNQKRGLLAADMGYPSTNPGFVDVYDISQDCLHPTLDSSTPLGILGHESAFSPDGTIFYVSSTGGHTLTAVDLTNPMVPSIIWFTATYSPHGMSISDDGNRLYMADTGNPGTPGLTILDVSQVQKHALNPTVPEISHTTWPEVSIPQNALPITIKGKPYVVEVDEYTNKTLALPTGIPSDANTYQADAKVGAARIIDISNEKAPKVISNMRLAVNQTSARATDQRNDPGAQSPVQGYAGHYCAVPQRTDPTIVACSFIVSGLRVFDIKDPVHPKEIAYFNGPVVPGPTPTAPGAPGVRDGAFAMSAPAFVPSRNEIWYTDGNSGFYVVRLTASAFAPAQPVVRTPTGAKPVTVPSGGGGSLPTTGLPALLPWLAVASAGLGVVLLRRRVRA